LRKNEFHFLFAFSRCNIKLRKQIQYKNAAAIENLKHTNL